MPRALTVRLLVGGLLAGLAVFVFLAAYGGFRIESVNWKDLRFGALVLAALAAQCAFTVWLVRHSDKRRRKP